MHQFFVKIHLKAAHYTSIIYQTHKFEYIVPELGISRANGLLELQ